MDLIAPRSRDEVVEALATARAAAPLRLLPVGGRSHLDKGNPSPVDAELELTALDRLVDYHPAEMVAVVEAGMRCGGLDELLAGHGQEWPVDAPAEATVGGVIAAAASSPRRLAVGPVRDSVLEVELVTGAGRRVRAGGRTVKNVSGYDLCRLLTGSLGTLGVLTQVAIKLRPRPRARRTVLAPGGLERAAELLAAVPLVTAVLVTPAGIELRLEGWPEDLEEQTRLAGKVLGGDVEVREDAELPLRPPWSGAPVVVEAAVAPARLAALVEGFGDGAGGGPAAGSPEAGGHAAGSAGGAVPWGALAGVGICWVGLPDAGEGLARLRRRAAELGGIAPVVRGPGGLGAAPAAPAVHQRLKDAFDPAGVLAPGRFWGGL
jgi:glycolate oxidase FAD binding subunit